MPFQNFNQYPINYPQYNQGLFNQQNAPPRQEIVKVSGRNGAEAYQMSPNSSALLLDETAPIVWLKTTDGAGFPTLSPYSITPHKAEEPVDVRALEERITRLEEAVNASKSHSVNAPKNRGRNDAGAEPKQD